MTDKVSNNNRILNCQKIKMKKSIERIISRPAKPGMVGDGFRVFNYIPGDGIPQQRISPFLILDFNAA